MPQKALRLCRTSSRCAIWSRAGLRIPNLQHCMNRRWPLTSFGPTAGSGDVRFAGVTTLPKRMSRLQPRFPQIAGLPPALPPPWSTTGAGRERAVTSRSRYCSCSSMALEVFEHLLGPRGPIPLPNALQVPERRRLSRRHLHAPSEARQIHRNIDYPRPHIDLSVLW